MFCFCNFTRGISGVHNSRVRNGTVEVFSSPSLFTYPYFIIFVALTVGFGCGFVIPAIFLCYVVLSLPDDQGLPSGQLGLVVTPYIFIFILTLMVQIYVTFVFWQLKGQSIKVDNSRVCIQSYLSVVPTSRLGAVRIVLHQTTIDLDDIINAAVFKHKEKRNDNNDAEKSPFHYLQIAYVSRSKRSQLYKTCEIMLNPDVPETMITALLQYMSKSKEIQSQILENINSTDSFISAMQATEYPELQDHSQRHIELGKHYTMYIEGESTKIKLFDPENLEFSIFKSTLKFNQVAFVAYLAIIGASVVRHIQLYGISNKMIGYLGVLIPLVNVCILYAGCKQTTHSIFESCHSLTLHEQSMVIQYCFGIVEIQYQTIAELKSKQNIHEDGIDEPAEVNKLEISYNDKQGKDRTAYITTSAMLLSDIKEIEEIIRQKITNRSVSYKQIEDNILQMNSATEICTQYN